MTKEQEKKFAKLIQPLVEEIVKKQKLNEGSESKVQKIIDNISDLDPEGFVYFTEQFVERLCGDSSSARAMKTGFDALLKYQDLN